MFKNFIYNLVESKTTIREATPHGWVTTKIIKERPDQVTTYNFEKNIITKKRK